MASYGGASIFGRAVRMTTSMEPADRQETAYPGQHGVTSIALGARGGQCAVSGVLLGNSLAALVAQFNVWRGYQRDGRARVLVDNEGNTFAAAVVVEFQLTDRVHIDSHGYSRTYQAQFRILN